MYTIGPLKEVNKVLFLRNKRFNFMLFYADYYLRWWRLPLAAKQIWVAVITIWGTLDSLPRSVDSFNLTALQARDVTGWIAYIKLHHFDVIWNIFFFKYRFLIVFFTFFYVFWFLFKIKYHHCNLFFLVAMHGLYSKLFEMEKIAKFKFQNTKFFMASYDIILM